MAGLVFLSSAIFKFISIDAFELYLYSLDWFPLLLCFYLARLLIGFEFALGLALLAFAWRRWVNVACYAVLGLFSVFLLYLVAQGYDGNCHCMGEAVDLPPVPSLAKNAVLAALIAVSANARPYRLPSAGRVVGGLSALALALVIIVSPPDGIRSPKPAQVHAAGVERFVESDSLFKSAVATQPKALVCLFSTGRRVCKLSAHKLQLMVDNNHVPAGRIYTVFHGQPEKRDTFLKEAQMTGNFVSSIIPHQDFGNMVGMVPAFILFEYGEMVDTYTYRSLTEDVVRQLAY